MFMELYMFRDCVVVHSLHAYLIEVEEETVACKYHMNL